MMTAEGFTSMRAVFDGDLKAFMEEYLRFKKNKEKN